MLNLLRHARHRLLHWLQLEPCWNFIEVRDGVYWHVVSCDICGERVLEWPDRPLSSTTHLTN